MAAGGDGVSAAQSRSEEHTSELQSQSNLVCRLLLEKKNRAHISALAIPSSKNFFTTSSKFAFEEYSRRIFEPSIFGWPRLRRVENGSDASERLTSSTSAFFCKKSATWGLGALLDSSRSTSASGSLGFLDSLAIDPIELWRSCRSSSFTNTIAV